MSELVNLNVALSKAGAVVAVFVFAGTTALGTWRLRSSKRLASILLIAFCALRTMAWIFAAAEIFSVFNYAFPEQRSLVLQSDEGQSQHLGLRARALPNVAKSIFSQSDGDDSLASMKFGSSTLRKRNFPIQGASSFVDPNLDTPTKLMVPYYISTKSWDLDTIRLVFAAASTWLGPVVIWIGAGSTFLSDRNLEILISSVIPITGLVGLIDAAGYGEVNGLAKAVHALFFLQRETIALQEGSYPVPDAQPSLFNPMDIAQARINGAMVLLDQQLWLFRFASLALACLTAFGLLFAGVAILKAQKYQRKAALAYCVAAFFLLFARLYQYLTTLRIKVHEPVGAIVMITLMEVLFVGVLLLLPIHRWVRGVAVESDTREYKD